MALILTVDIGDIVIIEDIKIKYSKKIGRKINLAVEAPREKKITIKKAEKIESTRTERTDNNN